MTRMKTLLIALTCMTLSLSAFGQQINWHSTLEKGLAEAKMSGKSVLVITIWKPKV